MTSSVGFSGQRDLLCKRLISELALRAMSCPPAGPRNPGSLIFVLVGRSESSTTGEAARLSGSASVRLDAVAIFCARSSRRAYLLLLFMALAILVAVASGFPL